ncbi:hypothetical protein EOPP23_09285 [Endozoicomonas sp. OPT23]|uniref:efflux RND transporter periplasmic adaptor subunit n=1 Tax=Endozoicomonas sp. OPT23 TaxID=2072845 RepID=UPI00129BC5E5|nr:hypothetical protein [Endozoicomonas sp. OPT23]MRI33175.1 hypothetical protein [Endozoicomonas sp. OPT23]
MELLKRKWMLPLIAVLGLLCLVLIIKLKPATEHNQQVRPATPVNVIAIENHSVRPTITGFGVVKPDLLLQAKAEVSGRITWVHPALKKGEILPKDTLVMMIDDKDYQLALKQAEADLLVSRTNLKEKQLTIKNNQLELKLANEKLKVRQAELKRFSSLNKSGSVSQSRLDQERQTLLQQQQEVQKLENQRTTLPSELEVMKAKIQIAEAKVEQSKRDLERTRVVLPFAARISAVHVEQDQYIGKGNSVFDAAGIQKVMINAQFSMDQFARFARGFGKSEVSFGNGADFPVMSQVLDKLGLTATVEVAGSSFKPWQAKVERFSDSLDLQSRTVGVIVSVEGSYRQAEPGVKPPLIEGMYMQISLQSKPSEFLVLPRFALHEGEVFKVSEDNSLVRQKLDDLLLQGDLALLKSTNSQGLKADEKLIVSDVFPAVNGMRVEAIEDQSTAEQVNRWLEAMQ